MIARVNSSWPYLKSTQGCCSEISFIILLNEVYMLTLKAPTSVRIVVKKLFSKNQSLFGTIHFLLHNCTFFTTNLTPFEVQQNMWHFEACLLALLLLYFLTTQAIQVALKIFLRILLLNNAGVIDYPIGTHCIVQQTYHRE